MSFKGSSEQGNAAGNGPFGGPICLDQTSSDSLHHVHGEGRDDDFQVITGGHPDLKAAQELGAPCHHDLAAVLNGCGATSQITTLRFRSSVQPSRIGVMKCQPSLLCNHFSPSPTQFSS